MSLTIDEVKKRKVALESEVLKLFKTFEKETSAFLGYVEFERKPSKKVRKNDISNSVRIPEPERDGPIINVNISLRFDI